MMHSNPEESSKKKRILIFAVASAFVASFVLSMSIFYVQMDSKVEANNQKISSLIDEVGELKQEKFELTEKLNSQVGVLKAISEDFSQIEQMLSGAAPATLQDLRDAFAQLQGVGVAKVATANSLNIAAIKTTDFLILGTNGNLTDTIMIASANEATKKVNLISIPRDLYINGRRINEYYYYYGVSELERMLEDITGLSIEKYAKIDFNGFMAIIDKIGGIDVHVDKAIFDGYYPNSKGGYDTYSIEVGDYHMSGEEALKYARSRKSTTDFDRVGRQQIIVEAVKDELLNLHPLSDLKALTDTLKTAMTYTETDVNLFDAISYYYDFSDYDVNPALVISNQNYLYSGTNQSGAYMLLPNKGNYNEIKAAISELVNK